ncbi:MAG: DUF2231 domain-containing protein [candidate division Zixibacteria bacterium]|nr:DUF2231 domain-containing protein [candidate division Zixibacteria bacterium]
MQMMHPLIVHFAVTFFVAAMITESLSMLTGKRFWKLVADYHLMAAAAASLAAVITGFIDYGFIWMSDPGFETLRAHMVTGFIVFFIIQLMANYRFYMHKMLPEKMKMGYLILGGLGLGLIFGTAFLGKTAVYNYGTGVYAAMHNYKQTEQYLTKLYSLDELPTPTAEDSLLALPFKPGYDSLQAEADSLNIEVTEHHDEPAEESPAPDNKSDHH